VAPRVTSSSLACSKSLLIEALRSTAGTRAASGLLRGLADERVAVAIRRLHERPTKPWTVAQLAKEARLSRSTFFERFSHAVGVAPMEYLLGTPSVASVARRPSPSPRSLRARRPARRQRRTFPRRVGNGARRPAAAQIGYASTSTSSLLGSGA
jgi:hypothetical protein